ncbi:unnamed protein product, partial [Ectocarpus sp. 12 AP-2014]
QLPLLATFVVSLGFLLSMTRRKVDEEKVRKACAAIDDGMSVRKAAEVFGVGRTSIEDRRRGKVAMNAKVGPETILSKKEEDSLEDILLFAARNFLAVDRVHLRDAVRLLCNDRRRIPWDPEKGPGKDWLAGFLRRHPRVAERSTRIYEANRITEDEEPRMAQFYERWAALLDEVKPEANHVHNTDETGMVTSRGSFGLPDGGNITAPEFLDAVAEKERADKAGSDAKAARAKVREEKREEKA